MSASFAYLWVLLGLEALGDGGDGEWGLAVHHPRHQVGAVAAEVGECAVAVLLRVSEPREELGLYADLLRALMPVADDGLDDRAERVVLQQVVGLGVAGVPGSFKVDEDVDLRLLGDALHREGVRIGDGKGFFPSAR